MECVYVHVSVMDRRLPSSYGDQLELKSLSLCWHFWGKTNRDRCEHSLVSGFVPETLLILQHKCKCYSPHAEKYIVGKTWGWGIYYVKANFPTRISSSWSRMLHVYDMGRVKYRFDFPFSSTPQLPLQQCSPRCLSLCALSPCHILFLWTPDSAGSPVL